MRAPHACRARTAYRRCPPTWQRHWAMDCHSLRTHSRLIVLVVAGRLGLAGAVYHLLRRLWLPAHSSDASAEYGIAVRDGVGAESRLRARSPETDDFSLEHMRDHWPNHALQRTRPSRSGCNSRVLWAGSLSLGRSVRRESCCDGSFAATSIRSQTCWDGCVIDTSNRSMSLSMQSVATRQSRVSIHDACCLHRSGSLVSFTPIVTGQVDDCVTMHHRISSRSLCCNVTSLLVQ